MNYEKSAKYDPQLVKEKIMGSNPIKLTEEMLTDCKIPAGARVLDLGSGQGLTSVFLAKEYGFHVYAADLWSDPLENTRFFEQQGLSANQITAVKANASDLPFEHDFFDGVVCTDSYNYFGRDTEYLDSKLLPYVKSGGYIYISVPGMVKDCHDTLPQELLCSWTPEQLDYIHDADYWLNIVQHSKLSRVITVKPMESNEEVWADWLECDNDYARGDRAAFEAGGGKYMNFVQIVLQKK